MKIYTKYFMENFLLANEHNMYVLWWKNISFMITATRRSMNWKRFTIFVAHWMPLKRHFLFNTTDKTWVFWKMFDKLSSRQLTIECLKQVQAEVYRKLYTHAFILIFFYVWNNKPHLHLSLIYRVCKFQIGLACWVTV